MGQWCSTLVCDGSYRCADSCSARFYCLAAESLLTFFTSIIVSFDLFSHDGDVLVDFGCDPVDTGICEGDSCTMGSEMGRTSGRTFQSATSNLFSDFDFVSYAASNGS